MKNAKPVYLEWVDSVSQSGWQSKEELKTFIKETTSMLVTSVGYIEFEDKHCVVLVHSRYDETTQRHGVIKIPKRAITKRRNLK